MVGGAMGVGKTTLCDALYKTINKSVWLDGDWCWMMHPWNFSETNKKMVFKNIIYLLNSYLANDCFRVIIFSWVLHEDKIYTDILTELPCEFVDIYKISLVIKPELLRERLHQNNVPAAAIKNSIERLECYKYLDTVKLDTSGISIKEEVMEVRKICELAVM